MYGAILGDMIGAPYEFDRGGKTKDFPLFSEASAYTDDTVMTIAVAEALMNSTDQADEAIRKALIESMQAWGRRYPQAGYGGMFRKWLREEEPRPYNSFGNGSAMRVSPAGWMFDTLEKTRHVARITAEVTHNHPEGIKGAEATASAIFMARTGSSREEIRDYIIREFGYDLSRTCDEIRPGYHHVESCQETVPEAITAFMEGTGFEDVQVDTQSAKGESDHPVFLEAALEMFQNTDNSIERDEEGHLRASAIKDMLMVYPEFRLALKKSKMKPLVFLQQLFDGKINIYRNKEIYWACIADSVEHDHSACKEESADNDQNCAVVQRKQSFYEQAFNNIQNQLSNAGLEKEVADEIANIFMRSKSAVEPRKVIHTLLCQRFGTKQGAKYYRQTVKYIGA